MKTKPSLFHVALACVILGCDKKPAPPPAKAEPSTTQQPVVQPPAIKPPAPDAVATTKKPAQPAEVLDLDAMLKRIPANEFTVSEKGGWDKFTMPKVQKWVRENLYGKRGRANVCMLQCNVAQEDANSKPDEWKVSLQVTGIHANYAGMANRILPIDKEDQTDDNPSVGIWGKASFTFKCSEAEARKWDAHKPLAAATVEGDVAGISFQPRLGDAFNEFFIGYDIFVQLDNVVLTPSKDKEPVVLYGFEFMMAVQGSLR